MPKWRGGNQVQWPAGRGLKVQKQTAVTYVGALIAAALFAPVAHRTFSRAGTAASRVDQPLLQELARISNGQARVVDMTYAINDKLPKWPGDERAFEAKTNATFEKDGYFTRSFWMLEHYATHMDAPAHFPPGKETLDQLPVAHFFGPAVVIDVRADAAKDADYRLTTGRVEKWEEAHGRIPTGAIALLLTGWASRWPDEARYRNTEQDGVMHFPGYSVEAAKLLMLRGVVGLGIDTLSIDYGPSKNFEVHHVDLPAGLFNLENVANLDQLPETGAFVIAAPIKLEGGSGGPVRIFGILPSR
jgi:kynurenine formamidase